MSILTDYNVTFGVKKVRNSNVKFIRSINPILDAIISDFRGVNHCDNLLGAINDVLNVGQQGGVIYPTLSLQVIRISFTTTKIYRDPSAFDLNINPSFAADYTLPTADFKEIVKAWRNFVVNGNLLT
jgi:hypothetical protein